MFEHPDPDRPQTKSAAKSADKKWHRPPMFVGVDPGMAKMFCAAFSEEERGTHDSPLLKPRTFCATRHTYYWRQHEGRRQRYVHLRQTNPIGNMGVRLSCVLVSFKTQTRPFV